MSIPSAIEAVRADLFTDLDQLRQKYPAVIVEKILRVREMFNWFVANPNSTDRRFVEELLKRHDISRVTAYNDLSIVKTLLPLHGSASRQFHRWRTNEMLLETYRLAERRKDTRTMERVAASYGRTNAVHIEEDPDLPYDKIPVQPFTATDDPSVLGIKPIPNLRQKIDSLLERYRRESIDIEDVEYEDADLELDTLFPEPVPDKQSWNRTESTSIPPSV